MQEIVLQRIVVDQSNQIVRPLCISLDLKCDQLPIHTNSAPHWWKCNYLAKKYPRLGKIMKKIKDDSGGLQSILWKKKYYIDMPDPIHLISDVLSVVKPRAFMLKIELRYKMLNLARHSIYMRWKHCFTILTTKLEGAQNKYKLIV